MPELPDIVAYIEALRPRITGRPIDAVQLKSPFVLRSVDPPLDAIRGQAVCGIRRVGKRIVLEFPDALFLVFHLMVAGRLRWREPDQKAGIGGRLLLMIVEFAHGRLLFTEAGSKKRASIMLVRGEPALAALDPGGLEPIGATLDAFRAALTRESHTVKRALTDPHLISGIGNAYSDEILHAARLSPLTLTRSLSEAEVVRLHAAVQDTLTRWVALLRAEHADRFPERVTAFRDGMAVHGRFGQPCPVCGAPVQRIVYADNECNYCARCQTGGRRLADRAMSRLLGADWPRGLDG